VVQDCFPFGAVAFLPLLLEEFIDIRITPIGIGPLRGYPKSVDCAKLW
jgi:hypothetical protein